MEQASKPSPTTPRMCQYSHSSPGLERVKPGIDSHIADCLHTRPVNTMGAADEMEDIAIPAIDPMILHGLDDSELPPPLENANGLTRCLRWHSDGLYRCIFIILLSLDSCALTLLVGLSSKYDSWVQALIPAFASLTSGNLLLSLLCRNEHVVNALFWMAGTCGARLPFWARRRIALVYSYGAFHSAGAIAATLSFGCFLGLLTFDYYLSSVDPSRRLIHWFIMLLGFLILIFLVVILAFSHPEARRRRHDAFECIHRFCGWSVLLLYWAQVMLLAEDSRRLRGHGADRSITFGHALVISPSFWMLITMTILVAYPWTRLRKRPVEAEFLSQHCLKLDFFHRDVHYGQAVRLTDNPLKETHPFAVVPFPRSKTTAQGTKNFLTDNGSKISVPSSTFPHSSRRDHSLSSCGIDSRPSSSYSATDLSTRHLDRRGFSVFISNAGDWTSKMIRNPPKAIYVRGTPQFGVMRIAGLFRPVIVMATGSGIGPCMALFVQRPEHPVRIIWSARDPLKTYGRELVAKLYETDPLAIIIDTSKTGTPDLVKIAYRVWEASGSGGGEKRGAKNHHDVESPAAGKTSYEPCEAVIFISNQKITRKVVFGLESRGVPAYGAIFDS